MDALQALLDRAWILFGKARAQKLVYDYRAISKVHARDRWSRRFRDGAEEVLPGRR